ncbi:MAG: hypothetical protein ACK526_18470 [Planctomyces sp.]
MTGSFFRKSVCFLMAGISIVSIALVTDFGSSSVSEPMFAARYHLRSRTSRFYQRASRTTSNSRPAGFRSVSLSGR